MPALVGTLAFFAAAPYTWLHLGLVLGVAATTVAFWLYVFGPLRVRRYWFEFDVLPTNGVGRSEWVNRRLGGGCGVSGRSELDCLELIRRTLVEDSDLPPVRQVIADVDLSSLSRKVQRSMDFPHERGVWYPPVKTRTAAQAEQVAN